MTDGPHRRELARDGLSTVANLLLMGILLDSVFQWMILGASYPGPALIVGPVLITMPYAIARALANRATRGSGGSRFEPRPRTMSIPSTPKYSGETN